MKPAEAGYSSVVCIGGDGTLCEAVDELCYQNVTLYVVPGGTGNDFARAFGLPKDPLAAFERQLAGTPVQIDCGLAVNGKLCFKRLVAPKNRYHRFMIRLFA